MSLKDTLFIILLAGTPLTAVADEPNILDVSRETPSAALILPESFETDTKAMLDSWYLNKYAVIDTQADSRPDAEVTDEMLSMIDVLVDGEFRQELKNITLKFRGSENQRIINVKKSLEAGEVISYY